MEGPAPCADGEACREQRHEMDRRGHQRRPDWRRTRAGERRDGHKPILAITLGLYSLRLSVLLSITSRLSTTASLRRYGWRRFLSRSSGRTPPPRSLRHPPLEAHAAQAGSAPAAIPGQSQRGSPMRSPCTPAAVALIDELEGPGLVARDLRPPTTRRNYAISRPTRAADTRQISPASPASTSLAITARRHDERARLLALLRRPRLVAGPNARRAPRLPPHWARGLTRATPLWEWIHPRVPRRAQPSTTTVNNESQLDIHSHGVRL